MPWFVDLKAPLSVAAITSVNPAKKVVIYNEPAAGGTLEAIQSKYKLTPAQEKSLLNEYKAAKDTTEA